jgi:hypothetical protein
MKNKEKFANPVSINMLNRSAIITMIWGKP